ncbi:hypothetical protein K9L27_02055 [Candidatus Gracilibacteria bacterium]|nr:hypothetical protein [Candidatus Gracilibacteria bacterium]
MSKVSPLEGISLPKLILQVKQVFKGESCSLKEFNQKKEWFLKLGKIILSSEVWRAYFLPSNIHILKKNEYRIKEYMSDDIYNIKESVLNILGDTKELKRISDITDPLHEISQTVTLLLLEVIFLLQNSKNISKKNIYLLTLIADNFGLWKIRYILEDEAFRIKNKDQYDITALLLQKQTEIYQKLFTDIIGIIRYQFQKSGLNDFKIVYRKKNVYGVYKKMKLKGQNINHVTDFFAFRIIVKTISECYQVLEILHHLWPHYPKKLKDYIEQPKSNQYQSIHTTLQCLQKNTVEFQIRTESMDSIAKFGPASHSLYKAREGHI